MEHARKMILVPEETINRFQGHKPNSPLDGEMNQILKSDLSDYEKWCLYQQALHKFKNPESKTPAKVYLEHWTPPTHPAQTPPQPTPPTHPAPAQLAQTHPAQPPTPLPVVKNEMTLTVPPKIKTKAFQLFDLLKLSSGFDYNSDGEIYIKGQLLKNSNLSDLVTDALRSSKFKPQYADEFIEYLGEINAPHHLINNPERRAQLTSPNTKPGNKTPNKTPTFDWTPISTRSKKGKK
jgi:hypothetical protein